MICDLQFTRFAWLGSKCEQSRRSCTQWHDLAGIFDCFASGCVLRPSQQNGRTLDTPLLPCLTHDRYNDLIILLHDMQLGIL